ncbi:tetratricopeptide repeat protein [Isobaculum melis]|uniref:Tetratricopeptide repeat-containing protein n=1 Tax=Isobaculum melis TaxID=142588 RepID=A0A1H9QKB7_9LACT|nr:tetratricopeptide repeat protein [Isobaculum melis]SER60956.1 Tetratricopeptide repeat-containing protein [Isobaculum melis]
MVKDEHKTARIIEFIPNTEFYFNRGIIAFQKNKIQLAKKYLLRAADFCQTDDERAYTLCQLAICHQHTGEYAESIQILEALLESIDKEFPEAYYFLANNYAFLNDFEKALEAVQRYLREDPNGDFINEAEELLDMVLYELNED